MDDKTDREIMQMALEMLELCYEGKSKQVWGPLLVMAKLRERLAQPEQEPVAWLSADSIGERYLWFSKPLDNDKAQPLYTARKSENGKS